VKDEENSQGDIEITYTGLRPGEKLYEELIIGDYVSPTEHKKIMRAEEEVISWDILESLIQKLQDASRDGEFNLVRELLQQAVSGYKPQCHVVDELTLALESRTKHKSNVVKL
ncbi:MAG: polysaccharide biosynthesis protein, partial [Gammaproteobacteria bacterium]|nr:polysaccharide biosynthesis protein [Gammaproteobacteria bacterium]